MIAISKRYSYDTSTFEIVDAAGNRRNKDDFDAKVDVYEDRVNGWFLDFANDLLSNGDANYVVLQIALAQLEGIEQFFTGQSSKGKSGEFFENAMIRVFHFAESDRAELRQLYAAVRCGLFHNGFTQGTVLVSRQFGSAISFEQGSFQVNAEQFLVEVRREFCDFVALLRNTRNQKIRDNFEGLWDSHWQASKAKQGPPYPASTTQAALSGSFNWDDET